MNGQPTLVIESGKLSRQYWIELWRYRELVYFLAWRDILVRYKQTVIGILWSLIRPILTMIVFTIIFHKLARMDSGSIPYPVLVYAAMVPWQFFSDALVTVSNSLITNANIVSKVYFPRLIMPLGKVAVSLIDLGISLVMMTALMIWYQIPPTWHLLLLPLLIALASIVALGAGLWLAALSVKYRDFTYIIPFMIQFGLYVSPVGFSSEKVPAAWRFYYSLNPMVGLIEGFRWSLFGGTTSIYWPGVATSLVIVGLMTFGGLGYFRHTERTFADVI